MGQSGRTISAEAILKSKSGRSLAHPDAPVTAENVEDFKPTPETLSTAIRRFKELGFEVIQSGITLTLVGGIEQFETTFGVKLSIENDTRTGRPFARLEGEPTVPESLADIVETVVFPRPPEYFGGG
ncbi:MAG: protease pro-enzyme activation domain-containing protein [Halobacteriota archaeon]